MKRRAVFRPEAEAELCEARDWYEAHSSGLGAVFVREIERAIAALLENPGAFRKVYGQIRRIVLKRFPYAIYFRAARDEILVIAVMHGRRHPRRWRSRR